MANDLGVWTADRVAMTAELLIALFVGLSVPVIGAGLAQDEALAPGRMTTDFRDSIVRRRRRRSPLVRESGKESS
jgi:hypothetical protein